MLKRKIQVPLKRYAHPEYLRDLCNRIEACYFSPDRDWSCIEAIFAADIKAMEQREPKVAPPVPPKPAIPTFNAKKVIAKNQELRAALREAGDALIAYQFQPVARILRARRVIERALFTAAKPEGVL